MMTAVQHDEASEMVVQMLRVAYRDMPRDKFLEMTERMIQQLEKIAAASSRDERMRLIKNLNF